MEVGTLSALEPSHLWRQPWRINGGCFRLVEAVEAREYSTQGEAFQREEKAIR